MASNAFLMDSPASIVLHVGIARAARPEKGTIRAGQDCIPVNPETLIIALFAEYGSEIYSPT
jgi:hypothetical protein